MNDADSHPIHAPALYGGSGNPPGTDLSTVLVTNGNLLSMLSLGAWMAEYGHHLRAVVVTTKLPSTRSNVSGVARMFMDSGLAYTHFKLNTNRFLPTRLGLQGMPTTIEQLARMYRLPADFLYVDNVNEPWVVERVRAYRPSILLSFSATSRFKDELIETPSRVAINVHYALLPEYAGLSPYYWYVHNREAYSGITMHVIHSKLDAGPIICQERFASDRMTSVLELLNRQMELVSPVLSRFYSGQLNEHTAVPQNLSKRTYFRHPTREQIKQFYRNGLTFSRREDVDRLKSNVRFLHDRAAEVVRNRPPVSPESFGRLAPLSQESLEVANEWYVPPKPPVRKDWIVFSLGFVLATLQGQITEPHQVRRTMPWLIVGTVVRAVMALLQVLIMVLAFVPVASWFLEILARTFTRNGLGFFLRSCYWKARLKRLGTDTIIDQGVEIWGPANVSIGSNCHIDTNVRLAAGERRHKQHGSIEIGDFVHLGPGVHIAGRGGVRIGDYVGISSNAHLYSATGTIERPADPGQLIGMSHMAPRDQQHTIERPIVIEPYSFIGMMTRILPGVRVGFGAVVHANCELTRDVPAFANIGGVARGRQIGWRRPRRKSPHLKPSAVEGMSGGGAAGTSGAGGASGPGKSAE